MKNFNVFLKKTVTKKGYFPKLVFDETLNTVSIQKNKTDIVALGTANLSNYYTKTETYTKTEVDGLLLVLQNKIDELEGRIETLES